MKKYIYTFMLFALYAPTAVQAQSGWTKPKDTYFLKVDYSSYTSSDFRNNTGNSLTTSDFTQNAISAYGEYGISNRLTAIAFVPFFKQNSYETTNKVSGFGDVKLELKYALLNKSFPLSVSIAPEFPTGKKDNFAVNKSNPLEQINLPSGDGEFNVWTTLAVSHTFTPLKLYASAYSAFNYRTKYKERDFQNQYQAGVEVGYQFFDRLWVNTKVSILTGVGAQPTTADFIRGDGTSYTGVSVGGLYEIGKNFGLTAQYFNSNSAIVKAKNIYANNILSFGIVYQKK
ncbi:transporter [Flavobacterium algicola]|uniref:transporter n=1 Tax=Flavobacterium algicola TaxID=556529 RepID=UPI001EFE833E|nr:transporter [Flavobacterium algicola]MCG9793285.1 transporter [Flavobacterium algicola]